MVAIDSPGRRLLIYGFHAPELVEAVRLAIRGHATVEHWIGVNRSDQSFDEDITDWHLGRLEPVPQRTASPAELAQAGSTVDRNLAQIQEQLRRTPACNALSNSEIREFAIELYCRFVRILREKQIDQLWFQNLPHEGFELLLYLTARDSALDTVLCYQSILPRRFFYCRALEDFGRFATCTELPVEPFQTPRQFQKRLFYMEGLSVPGRRRWSLPSIRSDFRAALQDWKITLGYYRLRGREPVPPSAAEQYDRQLRRTIRWRYRFRRPFVYFPLHLQPELTTSAIGYEYFDQVLAIEALSRWLPAGVDLVLKENPKQDHRWRGPDFFRRIQRLSNVHLVPTSTSTYLLLERCRFAATITGTVGWEAISGGKPVLVFGHPWYLSLPGVHRWQSAPDFATIAADRWEHDSFCSAVSALLRKSRQGILDLNYVKSVDDYDPRDNTQDVAAFMRSVIVSAAPPMV